MSDNDRDGVKLPVSTTPAPSRVQWDDFTPVYQAAIEANFRAKGIDPSTPAAQGTIRTNTELVPKRSQFLTRSLASFTEVHSLKGKRVVDLGCGYGAMTLYLAVEHGVEHIVGIDQNPVFTRAGVSASRDAGLDNVDFLQGNMTAIPVADGYANLVIVNNAFLYLTTRQDLRTAAREIHRVLAPGGITIFYQPNRWFYREAFTKLPFVHYLPRRLADYVVRRSGRRGGYKDIKLISPVAHSLLLRRAGFRKTRVIDVRGEGTAEGLVRFIVPYYCLTAVK